MRYVARVNPCRARRAHSVVTTTTISRIATIGHDCGTFEHPMSIQYTPYLYRSGHRDTSMWVTMCGICMINPVLGHSDRMIIRIRPMCAFYLDTRRRLPSPSRGDDTARDATVRDDGDAPSARAASRTFHAPSSRARLGWLVRSHAARARAEEAQRVV